MGNGFFKGKPAKTNKPPKGANHGGQRRSYQDLREELHARTIYDDEQYLGKRLGTSFGSDTNDNSLSMQDYSSHAIFAPVRNKQMISFRGLDDDEDSYYQARSNDDNLDVLRALQNDPSTADLLSGIDLDQLEHAGSDNSADDSDNVVVNDAVTNNVDHSGNTGVIMNDKKIRLGSGQAAKDFSTWTMRKRLAIKATDTPANVRPITALVTPPPPPPPPAPAPAPAVDASKNNNANLGANSGVISNSGNTIGQSDSCMVFVDRRDFQGDSLIPRGNGGGGQKGGWGGQKGKGSGSGSGSGKGGQNKSGGGGYKGQWGDNKGQSGGGQKQQGGQQKPKDSCACQCASRRSFDGRPVVQRSVAISGPDTRLVHALVERSCTIVKDGETQQHKWRGDCKRSTVAGRPVMEMFPRADAEL